MKKKIVALALGAACLSAPAGAAMYRCGSTFQDRPCESAEQQQTIRPGKGAGTAVVAPPPAAASSAPAAAEGAARASSAASAPRPASAKDGAQGAPAAASTAVPTSATARTAGNADCSKLRKQGTTLNMRQPAGGSAATAEPRRGGQKNPGEAGC